MNFEEIIKEKTLAAIQYLYKAEIDIAQIQVQSLGFGSVKV